MKADWPLIRLLCHQKILQDDLTVTAAARDAGLNRGVFAEFLVGQRPALAVHNLFAVLGWLGIHDWREICEGPGDSDAALVPAVRETGMAIKRGGIV